MVLFGATALTRTVRFRGSDFKCLKLG
jgi:hypothetical protein